MADSTIAAESVLLLNNWPDGTIPSLINAAPDDGFVGAGHHNVAAAKYKPGTMARVYNNGDTGTSIAGWATLMYARNSTTAIAAAYELCQPASATDPYYVSSTSANAIIADDICMLCATSISAMTIAYYGWFLVGGVCPGDWVTALATGDFPTDGTVIVGQAVLGTSDTPAKGLLEPQTAGELDAPVAFCLTADVAP